MLREGVEYTNDDENMAQTAEVVTNGVDGVKDAPNGNVPGAEIPLDQRPALYNWKTTNERGYSIKEALSGQRRPIKVICAGAGASGICLAKFIKDDAKNVDLVMYDKNHDVAGTWLENKYRTSIEHRWRCLIADEIVD